MVDAKQAGANGNTAEAAFHSERVALFTSQVSTWLVLPGWPLSSPQ